MMGNGYYGYSPADYMKDYSWIGDIGEVVAKVAYKLPELVKYNQSVKQNRQHNAETHMAMQEWVKHLQASDPEVWNAVAQGYGVSPGQLASMLNSQIRAPRKDEPNEQYTRSIVNDFAIPMMRAGASGGNLSSDAFVRGLSSMPRVIESGERQAEAMKWYQERAQRRQRRETEKKVEARRAHKETQAHAAQAGLELTLGQTPRGEMFREDITRRAGEIAPEVLVDPQTRAAVGAYPSRLAQQRERRQAATGAGAGAPKPPQGIVHQRMAGEVKSLRGEIRSNEIRKDAKNREMRAIEAELAKDDKQLISSKKLKPEKRAAKEVRLKNLQADIAQIEAKNEGLQRQVADSELAVQLYDEYGGEMSPEEIRKAIRSGYEIDVPQQAPAAGGAPAGARRVGRYTVTPR